MGPKTKHYVESAGPLIAQEMTKILEAVCQKSRVKTIYVFIVNHNIAWVNGNKATGMEHGCVASVMCPGEGTLSLQGTRATSGNRL